MKTIRKYPIAVSVTIFLTLLFSVTVFIKSAAANDSYASISTGFYSIRSSIDNAYGLDGSAAGIENGTNIQLWKFVDVNQQKFEIKKASGDYYTIRALHSGKMLYVADGSSASGANVQLWTANGRDAQLWRFKKAGNGYYYIQSKLGTYLDLDNGEVKNGQNIWQCTGNGSNAQKWKLVKDTTSNFVIQNGYYKVATKLNEDYVLDITSGSTDNGANLQLWASNSNDQQKFYISSYRGGYYQIRAYHSDKFLDVAGGSKASGTNVQQYDSTETAGQLWKISKAQSGYVYIQSKLGTYLAVNSGNAGNGSNILAYTGNKKNSQKWKLITSTSPYFTEISAPANKISASNKMKTYSAKKQSFKLGVKRLGNAKLSYRSNNAKIKVSGKGIVTIAARYVGSATITITSAATSYYKKTSKKITVTVKPKSAAISGISSPHKGTIYVKWKKTAGITKYQLQFSKKKNFARDYYTTYYKVARQYSSTTVTGFPKCTWYVRLRTYKTVGGKNYYSSWSKAKKLKVN